MCGVIRVLVVDDHEIVREGLKKIISQAPDISVTGEASEGGEALQKVEKDEYDVAMLDISLPDMNGLDVLAGIKRRRPELPVLMLSIHPEERYAVRALRAGAAGYLTKESARAELIDAIRQASKGRKYVTSSLAQRLVRELEADRDKPVLETLSDREYNVLCGIAMGNTIKQIASEMFLSPSTVSTYRSRILQKLGAKTNAELTRYAVEHKLVD
jgi:two-component system invasion response regulator UvrY